MSVCSYVIFVCMCVMCKYAYVSFIFLFDILYFLLKKNCIGQILSCKHNRL